jgi:2-methylfumaryl-CoA isomerase
MATQVEAARLLTLNAVGRRFAARMNSAALVKAGMAKLFASQTGRLCVEGARMHRCNVCENGGASTRFPLSERGRHGRLLPLPPQTDRPATPLHDRALVTPPVPVLSGLRVVEGSAFVAAPLGGMTLAQLGADVIRFDHIGGGLDYQRWPLAPGGDSLFWAGLNKGKRSIRIDLASNAGRELASALIAAPGPDAGLFLTNLPARGEFAYSALSSLREDLIMVAMTGNPDGTSELDYTVNPATGFPLVTGPPGLSDPVNSVLPAWDIAMGTLAAVALLAGERYRTRTGNGQLIQLSLSDVAFAMVGNLGRIAEAQLGAGDPPKDGNFLFGAFGNDFATRDNRRVMVVALTARQWTALKAATEIEASCAELQSATGHDLETATGRFEARHQIAELLRVWCADKSLAEIRETFLAGGVSWGPYQTFRQMLEEDSRVSINNPMFAQIEHPGIGSYLMPASPLAFGVAPRVPVRRAPTPGEHTEEILADVLRLDETEIARLFDRGIVAGS